MKEIGEKFKETRENIDIDIEEAALDLKVTKEELENIEDGNIKAFENVVTLKELIRSYSKYLGLDSEEMLDEYNEYLFDQTSKISLEDIKEAKRRLAKKEKKEERFRSPYTNFKTETKRYRYFIIGALVIIVLLCIGFVLTYNDAHNSTDKEVSDVIR